MVDIEVSKIFAYSTFYWIYFFYTCNFKYLPFFCFRVRIYYNNGEYVLVKLNYTESEDVKEIVQRLAHVSVGCEVSLLIN